MAILPVPQKPHDIEGWMLRYVVVHRLAVPCPTIRMEYVQGYYLTNEKGEKMLNDLGYPIWQIQGEQKSTGDMPLTDPALFEIIKKHEFDLASADDKYCEIANEYLEKVLLAPKEVSEENIHIRR